MQGILISSVEIRVLKKSTTSYLGLLNLVLPHMPTEQIMKIKAAMTLKIRSIIRISFLMMNGKSSLDA